MRNHFSVIKTSFFVALMMPTIACSEIQIEIGQSNSNYDGAGCDFYISKVEKPKLVKELLDKGRYGLFKYEHASGRPNLLIGEVRSGKEWKQGAAMNINGKEVLLGLVKQEPIQCLDEVHNKQIECTTAEYANQEVKIIVKPLTTQSSCWPDNSNCAGDAASVLVTIESNHSQKSLVMVGGCGE